MKSLNEAVKTLANRKDIRGLHDYAATLGGIDSDSRTQLQKELRVPTKTGSSGKINKFVSGD